MGLPIKAEDDLCTLRHAKPTHAPNQILLVSPATVDQPHPHVAVCEELFGFLVVRVHHTLLTMKTSS